MDVRLSWSPAALDDIDAIAEYIHRDSPAYASAVVSKLLEAAQGLVIFPNAGRIVPEFADNTIRECFVYSYRLIYRIQGSKVLVVAAVHGRRLLDPLLEQISDD